MYNSSDPFYNDICFKFSSEVNGKDVTLKDRRNEYYVNITFCENLFNYNYKIIKCYKLVFDAGNYDNAGTIFIFISIIISIICTFLYIKYHNIEPVKNDFRNISTFN